MRKIEFKELGMENFQGFTDQMIIPIDPGKLTLIVGPNGIGKTSIIDVFTYTPYGMTLKGAKGDDVVNNRVGKDCHTWIKFLCDEVPYELHRYHKHSEYGNTVHLLRDGDDKPIKKGHKDIRPVMESMWVPYKLLMNTTIFPQQMKTFFTDLSPSERQEVFRDMMNLSEWKIYYNKVRGTEETLSKDVEMNERTIRINIGLIDDLNQQYQAYLDSKKQFHESKKENLRAIRSRISELEKLLEKQTARVEYYGHEVDNDLRKCTDQISKIRMELKDIDLEEASIMSESESEKRTMIDDIQKQKIEHYQKITDEQTAESSKLRDELEVFLSDCNDSIQRKTEQITKIDLKLGKISFENGMLENQIKKYHEAIGYRDPPECPTCEQVITAETQEEFRTRIQNLEDKLSRNSDLRLSMTEKKVEINKLIQEIKDLILSEKATNAKKIKEFVDKSNKKHQKFEANIRSQIEKIQDEYAKHILKEMKNVTTSRKKLKKNILELTGQKEELEQTLSLKRKCEDDVRITEASLSTQVVRFEECERQVFDESPMKGIKDRIKDIEKNNLDIQEKVGKMKHFLKIVDFLKDACSSSGIPNRLIDDALPFMNSRVNQYLDSIGGRYTVSFDTQDVTKAGEYRDKISVNVLDNVTLANSRTQFSGGQTRIVDIASILTLSELQSIQQGIWFNVFAFDEIFDALDDQNTEYVSALLGQLKKDKAVIVISHAHIEQIEADEIISLR